MKKLLAIAMFLLIGASVQNTVQAQVRKNVIKVNPLSLGLLTLNGSYERVLTERVSVQLGAFYTGINLLGTSFRGVGITPEVRIFMSKNTGGAPQGWYVSPFFRYQKFDLSVEEDLTDTRAEAGVRTRGGGVLAGYQWLLGKADRVSLDLFIGPKYDKGAFTYDENASPDEFSGIENFSGFWIRSGLTLGVAF